MTNDGGLAEGSICPRGWKLPLSGNSSGSNNDKNGSFYKLIASYSPNDAVDADDEAIALAQPLNFVRAGFIGHNNGNNLLAGVGAYIRDWSRVSNSSASAYDIGTFTDGSVDPKGGGSRWVGLSVRCVTTSE